MEQSLDIPTLDEIRAARRALDDVVATTPVYRWRTDAVADRVGPETEFVLKLELFQVGGSFKSRGATLAVRGLSPEQLRRGVVTASGGNHAIAVAVAARAAGTRARVYMGRSANPFRQQRCRALGADVRLVDDIHQAFAAAREASETEGLAYIHPFEGKPIAIGTATVGLELMEQVDSLDAVVVPVGGGGLLAGIATAVKALNPGCAVYGVEPFGADTMYRSFQSGKPEEIAKIDTIADSLGSPTALPYSFGLCRAATDAIVRVSDDQLRWGMKLLFEEMKLVAEPAAAAATVAALGPLRETLRGKRVGVIVCGSNIDLASFVRHLETAPADLPD
ncbi:MAG: pyridoxal-phosphate dependent enzyme [Proteobacteria bacterium]|nr:pyridoxal-phosphate dependent enzyme [Pseudomonadota bacterium]